MQSASTTLPLVPVSDTPACETVARRSGYSLSEANPINLAAYTSHVQKTDLELDVLRHLIDMASHSGYDQNADSPTKSNRPIDLAVSSSRNHSQRSEQLHLTNPVNMTACAHKQPPDYHPPAAASTSVNDTSDASARSSTDINQASASVPHSSVRNVSTDVKDLVASSTSVHAEMCRNSAAPISRLASASSTLPQQTVAYPQGLGFTPAVPSPYQSAHWEPVLTAHTVQLMASAAVHTSAQTPHVDGNVKEGERNQLLLQLQVRFLSNTHLAVLMAIYTVSQKNPCDYVFDNNLNSKHPIVIIFGTVIT